MFKKITNKIDDYKARKEAKAVEAQRLKKAKIRKENTIRFIQLFVGGLMIGLVSYGLCQQDKNLEEFILANVILVAIPFVLYALILIWLDTVFGLIKMVFFLIFYFTVGIFFLPFIFLFYLIFELFLKGLFFKLIQEVIVFFVGLIFD